MQQIKKQKKPQKTNLLAKYQKNKFDNMLCEASNSFQVTLQQSSKKDFGGPPQNLVKNGFCLL